MKFPYNLLIFVLISSSTFTQAIYAQAKVRSFIVGSKHYTEGGVTEQFGFKRNEDVLGANRSARMIDKILMETFNSESKLVLSKADEPVTDFTYLLESTWIYDSTAEENGAFNFVYLCGHGATSKYNNIPYFFPGNSLINGYSSNANTNAYNFGVDPATQFLVPIFPLNIEDDSNVKGMVLGDFCQSFYDHDSSISREEMVDQNTTSMANVMRNSLAQTPIDIDSIFQAQNFDFGSDSIANLYREALLKMKDTFAKEIQTFSNKISEPTIYSDLVNEFGFDSFHSFPIDSVYMKSDFPVIISSPPGLSQPTAQDPTTELSFARVGPLGRRLYLALKGFKKNETITLGKLVDKIMDPNLDTETAVPMLYWNGNNKDLVIK